MRHEDWQTSLSNLIASQRQTAFDFPTFNCLMFSFDGIEAVTGDDLSLDYRGKYKNEKEAVRLLKQIDNVNSSQELLIKKLNGELQPISFARMGDIVFLEEANKELGNTADVKLFGPIPGICYGGVSYFVGEFGLVELSTLGASNALWVS